MKQDEIIDKDEVLKMARQAGFEDFDNWSRHYPNETKKWCERMEAFAKLVAAKEREACAKVCELESGDGPDNGCCPTFWNEAQEACAAAIRARGEA